VGDVCVDTVEASVWEIPAGNKGLINEVKNGRATLADLQAGAIQRGATSDDYGAGCPDTGNGCTNFYAASVAGVTPSRVLTWFQAAAACRNAGKRLLHNAEWQVAALGTPDGAPCIVFAGGPGPTGTLGCESDTGVFDMVGNLWEWVADWQAPATTCTTGLFGTGDLNCMGGAFTTYGPAALFRGGSFSDGTDAGVFAVNGIIQPSSAYVFLGFRCAR
jgi:formylglycine-generating enzyme required for sulfatase activity